MSKIFLTVNDEHFHNGLKFCTEYGINLEIETFSKPHILNGDLDRHIEKYRSGLEGFNGRISMHGPFHDLYSASADSLIREACKKRYVQSVKIAEKLNMELVIFHFNFIPFIKVKDFRSRWTKMAVDFWKEFDKEISGTDITVAIENLWEPDPDLIIEVLDKVGSDRFKVCFDAGHCSLFSEISLKNWIDRLGDYLYYVHVHNNSGEFDEHLPLHKGKIDYNDFFTYLKKSSAPFISMEFTGTHEDYVKSLDLIRNFFD
jgi:sugar phosphate isomerase/epimerase